jgi:hypothetical protein
MKIAISLLMFMALTAVGQTKKPDTSKSSSWIGTASTLSFPVPALVEIWDYDIHADDLVLPPATISSDGRKVYAITTQASWTCAPVAATSAAVTIVCVKSDTPKPDPTPLAFSDCANGHCDHKPSSLKALTKEAKRESK